MKVEHTEILRILGEFLEASPDQRFGQALYNLRITEFADEKDPEAKGFLLRDIYIMILTLQF